MCGDYNLRREKRYVEVDIRFTPDGKIQFSTFNERLRGECPFTYRRFWATFAPCFQQSGKSFFIFFIAAPMLLEIF